MEREKIKKYWSSATGFSSSCVYSLYLFFAFLPTFPLIQKVLRPCSSFWLSAYSFARHGPIPDPCN